ncbi:hypothetical protein ACS386_10675 [Flavobacteriaceae bacterium LMO-SS05]
MNKQIGYFFVFMSLFLFEYAPSQERIEISDIFLNQDILPIKLSYSIKEIKKSTNDSTYIDSNLDYQLDGTWQVLPVSLRRRGNNRLKNCYFPPLKVKIKKSISKLTPFEAHKNLKIVLPCLLQKDANDNIIKEYLAYKFFEIISPYYFKTRLLDIDFEEIKSNKTKAHQLKGILVEDDKVVAKRFDGKVYDRPMHPKNQEALSSIRNALFQYMIGNTDFSQAYQHNIKVIYINKEMVPIPYDFDMSGFVNCGYAVVSQIQGESLSLNSVRDRKYRGFARELSLFEQVRLEFINNKSKFLSILDDHASFFDDPREFNTARDYILSFFDIMVHTEKFKSEILDQARTN